jgi:hypothetical protein
VSLLKELPRALRRTDASEHAAIIAAVAAGTVTYEELHQKGRVSNATEESPVPTERDVAESDTDSSSSNEHRPGIFANLDELEKVAGSTRTALAQLNELVEAWKDDGGPDVDPILPRVRAIAGRLRSVATELENHILPEKVCARCCGEGCRACRGMGVNDRGDPEESDRYELRQSAGGVRVLGRRTMGRFRQRAAFSSFERSRVGRRGQVQVVVAKSRPRCRGRGSAG